MIFVRSLIFNAAVFGWTGLLCLLLWWMPATLSRPRLMAVVRWYLGTLHWLERTVIGLTYRIAGAEHRVPGAAIYASKHQSMWETMKLHLLFDDPAIVLKRELMGIPIWGWFARRAEMIPVDRGAKARAVEQVVAGARAARDAGRPVVIYPQGTRTAPGATRSYKVGVFAVYEALALPVIPVALNSGVFWGRKSFHKRPGRITVEFLPPIEPGLDRSTFMARLERDLEAASNRLSLEAGGPQAPLSDPGQRRNTAHGVKSGTSSSG